MDQFQLNDDERTAIIAQLRQAMGRGVRIPNEQLPTILQVAFAEPTTESGHAGLRYVAPRTFTAASEWVQFLPTPGQYSHASFGSLDFTPEKYAAIVANFGGNVYGQDLPINVEHDYKAAGAVGWIREMRLAEDGSIEVRPEWNDRGRDLIDGDRFRYVSAEIYDQWQDPVSGDYHDNVAVGMAVCVRPHFKTDVLRPLAASEIVASDAGSDPQEGTGVPEDAKTQPPAAVTLTEAEIHEFREIKPKYEATVTELTEAKATILTQEGRIAALESDARKTKFAAIVNGQGGSKWFGDADQHVSMLLDLAQAFGEDSTQVKSYIGNNADHAKQLSESVLFKATGTTNGGDGNQSAWDRVQAEAKTLSEAKGVTIESATATVLSTNPELARQYTAERR
jgi:hypothetical protein